jgi:hypothetical protein
MWVFSPAMLLLVACKIDRSNDIITNSSNRYSHVDMKEGTASLKFKHKVVASTNKIEIYYEQSGEKFCVNKQSMWFNPALDLSSINRNVKNSTLKIIPKQPISEFFPGSSAYFNVNEKDHFKILHKNSDILMIDIEDFYLNKNTISKVNKAGYVGYLSVEFFLCSELFGHTKYPVVSPLIYKISLQ